MRVHSCGSATCLSLCCCQPSMESGWRQLDARYASASLRFRTVAPESDCWLANHYIFDSRTYCITFPSPHVGMCMQHHLRAISLACNITCAASIGILLLIVPLAILPAAVHRTLITVVATSPLTTQLSAYLFVYQGISLSLPQCFILSACNHLRHHPFAHRRLFREPTSAGPR